MGTKPLSCSYKPWKLSHERKGSRAGIRRSLLEVPLPRFRTTWLLLPHALVLHSQAPKSPASGVKGA